MIDRIELSLEPLCNRLALLLASFAYLEIGHGYQYVNGVVAVITVDLLRRPRRRVYRSFFSPRRTFARDNILGRNGSGAAVYAHNTFLLIFPLARARVCCVS